MDANEIDLIKLHLNNYHNFAMEDDLSIKTLEPYLLPVFDKISGNLECYIEDLENGGSDEFNSYR